MPINIEPNGRPFVECAKCRVAVVIPPINDVTNLSAFARLRRDDPVADIRHAEEVFALGSRESKVLVLHVPREFGHCNRCGKPVAEGVSVCTCRSVNLNW